MLLLLIVFAASVRNRASSVDIAMCCRLDYLRSILGMARFFCSPQRPEWSTQSPIQWVMKAISQGVKRLRCEHITNLHVTSRLRMVELYHHSCVCLHGMVIN
jgi:hypothetical protein